MQPLLSYIILSLVTVACQTAGREKKATVDSSIFRSKQFIKRDTVLPKIPAPYDELKYKDKEILAAAPGTKSVIFNSSGTKLYAMNLEGMSVYEFDQSSRKIIREFKFTPTRGMGSDYNHSRPIASFQEKPVEACFSHGDEILWVSLHNAEGIVPIWVNDLSKNSGSQDAGQKTKPITVIYPGTEKKDSFRVPLIATGKTPKVIAKTADSKYLLVSNWHSRTTSILQMDSAVYPFGKVISTIPVSAIPRGIAVDNNAGLSYIAIMGGSSITVISNSVWMKEDYINVSASPRHLVMDTSGHLFVSYNNLGSIACIDAASGKQLFAAKTHVQPRTIVLSKNKKFIFVTCYSSDYMDVYKINADNFEKVASLPCGGYPVGVDIFEDDEKLEGWGGSYIRGSITIYSFNKKD